jgi:hypothetical protein
VAIPVAIDQKNKKRWHLSDKDKALSATDFQRLKHYWASSHCDLVAIFQVSSTDLAYALKLMSRNVATHLHYRFEYDAIFSGRRWDRFLRKHYRVFHHHRL